MDGNLDPAAVLRNGTPDEVYQNSVEAIKAAGAGGGFVPGSGRGVGLETPYENQDAMVAAARETPAAA
jgi:uroporphyrinogen decarboxylase